MRTFTHYLQNIGQAKLTRFLTQGTGQTDEESMVPYQAQMIGGVPVTLLDAAEANVAIGAATVVEWKGGIGTLLAYADDGANGGSWGGGAVKVWVKHPDASKWIQLQDGANQVINIESDRAVTFCLAAGVEIAVTLTGATSPDPITVVVM